MHTSDGEQHQVCLNGGADLAMMLHMSVGTPCWSFTQSKPLRTRSFSKEVVMLRPMQGAMQEERPTLGYMGHLLRQLTLLHEFKQKLLLLYIHY